jgi:hypothetical protein
MRGVADNNSHSSAPASPSSNAIALDVPADHEAFIDWTLDQALVRLEDGVDVTVDDLLHGREALRGQVHKMLCLAREIIGGIAPVRSQALPVIRGYTPLRELGAGGMGRVYLARQERLGGRPVALKVLPAGFGVSPRARERFQNEANAIARLRHPHIVAVHDVIEQAGVHAYAMEWVDGASLQAIIDALTSAEGCHLDPSQAGQAVRSQPGHAGGGRMAIVAATLNALSSSLGASSYEVCHRAARRVHCAGPG